MQMFDYKDNFLSIRAQAKLLGLCRSGLYYKHLLDADSEIANLIKEIYLDSDCRYGYRKVTASLHKQGFITNHKKVLRLMQDMSIQGLYPRKSKNTSLKNNGHQLYPYLLNDFIIQHPNQVWATDLTYIRVQGRFMYFMAIIDLHSRFIISSELSANMEVDFCVNVLNNALKVGVPQIFNTDQGSQFTSHTFINTLKDAQISISMDHKGRCFDNIFVERLWRTLKQEAIYYYRPETIRELEICLVNFVTWYNYKRLHQSLSYCTPASIYLGEKQITKAH